MSVEPIEHRGDWPLERQTDRQTDGYTVCPFVLVHLQAALTDFSVHLASTHSVCLTAVVMTSSQHTFDSVGVELGIRSEERLYVRADKVLFVSLKGESTLSTKTGRRCIILSVRLFNDSKKKKKTDQVANEQHNAPFPLNVHKGGCHIGS